MFGSVPLRTYLPDGDIDISIFTPLTGLNDPIRESWTTDVLRALEKEGSRRDAPFRIRNCQIIQAEVKLVKCVVANVVVDISFNALGGLCTVAFLEWVDRTIGRSHLFKRSIVLVKAWCYYEARLLGAHHSLISSYALEAMVLYVFNLYGKGLSSPLQVLQRFLQVFSSFDWDSYCLSMVGPIPLSSFPHPSLDVKAIPLETTLLDPSLVRNAIDRYSVQPKLALETFDSLVSGRSSLLPNPKTAIPRDATSSRKHVEVNLTPKHLNIMDPLLPSNNLGRSVSKASFARIRKAMAYGARDLERILNLEPLAAAQSIDAFFRNAWRSPTRIAADNQIFQQRLAMGGAMYLQQVFDMSAASNPTMQLVRHATPAQYMPSKVLSRGSNSLSVPDLSDMQNDYNSFSSRNSIDTQAFSENVGKSTVGQHHPSGNGTGQQEGGKVDPGGSDQNVSSLETRGEVSSSNISSSEMMHSPGTNRNTWQSVSQPVSPAASPRLDHGSNEDKSIQNAMQAVSQIERVNLEQATQDHPEIRSGNNKKFQSIGYSKATADEDPHIPRKSSFHASLPASPVVPRSQSIHHNRSTLGTSMGNHTGRHQGNHGCNFHGEDESHRLAGVNHGASNNLLHGATIGQDNFMANMDDLMNNLTIARGCQVQDSLHSRSTTAHPSPSQASVIEPPHAARTGSQQSSSVNASGSPHERAEDTSTTDAPAEACEIPRSKDLATRDSNALPPDASTSSMLQAVPGASPTMGIGATMASLPSLRVSSVVRQAPDLCDSYALVTAQGLTPSASRKNLDSLDSNVSDVAEHSDASSIEDESLQAAAGSAPVSFSEQQAVRAVIDATTKETSIGLQVQERPDSKAMAAASTPRSQQHPPPTKLPLDHRNPWGRPPSTSGPFVHESSLSKASTPRRPEAADPNSQRRDKPTSSARAEATSNAMASDSVTVLPSSWSEVAGRPPSRLSQDRGQDGGASDKGASRGGTRGIERKTEADSRRLSSPTTTTTISNETNRPMAWAAALLGGASLGQHTGIADTTVISSTPPSTSPRTEKKSSGSKVDSGEAGKLFVKPSASRSSSPERKQVRNNKKKGGGNKSRHANNARKSGESTVGSKYFTLEDGDFPSLKK